MEWSRNNVSKDWTSQKQPQLLYACSFMVNWRHALLNICFKFVTDPSPKGFDEASRDSQ